MEFETELTSINIQYLESVLHSMEKDFPKMKVTLVFDDEEKFKKFSNKMTPILKEDQDLASDSNSQASETEDQDTSGKATGQDQSSTNEIVYVEKLSRLEVSIILKQYYKEKIDQIAKETGVKILVVPEKLKFFGISEESIEQAKNQVHEIKINIIISSLQKYGKQVYESEFLRKKLGDCGIRLGKLAQKYYYWYEFNEDKQKVIAQVVSEVFSNNSHLFYPLLEDYQELRRRRNQKYIDAIIETRAVLYQKYLDHEINQDKNHINSQLNNSKTQIIIHIPIKQQSETIIYEIKKFYSQMVHFFIHYKVDQDEEIQNIDQMKKILDDNCIFWSLHQDLLVISLTLNKNLNRPNESIANISSFIENREKQFLQAVTPIFELNRNCYIEFLMTQQDEKYDQAQQKNFPFLKKVIVQQKKLDGIWVLSPKTQLAPLFVQIIDFFILKPITQKDKAKKKQPLLDDANVSQTINQTSIINDTTTLIETSNVQQMHPVQGEESLVKEEKIDMKKPVLSELRENLEFEKYGFLLEDWLGEKKYQDVAEIKRTKQLLLKCRQNYQNLLESATGKKFQIYNISIPLKLKVELPEQKGIVTMFVRDQDKDQFIKQGNLYVFLVNKSKVLISSGWLINVKKSDIKENNYKYDVEKGKFEIIGYIKYIDG